MRRLLASLGLMLILLGGQVSLGLCMARCSDRAATLPAAHACCAASAHHHVFAAPTQACHRVRGIDAAQPTSVPGVLGHPALAAALSALPVVASPATAAFFLAQAPRPPGSALSAKTPLRI